MISFGFRKAGAVFIFEAAACTYVVHKPDGSGSPEA